jgi:HEAT repeat protein
MAEALMLRTLLVGTACWASIAHLLGAAECDRSGPAPPSSTELTISIDESDEQVPLSDLTQALRSDDLAAAVAAANIIAEGDYDPADVVPVLVEALGRGPDELRIAVSRAIEWIGSDAVEAVPELAVALRAESAELRASSLSALSSIGPDAAVAIPVIVSLLEQDESDTHLAAIETLSAMGPEARSATPAIARMLQVGSPDVRSAALECLASIGPGAADSVPAIMRVFQDGTDELRRSAVQTLAAMGPAAKVATPILADMLRHGPDELHELVLQCLASIGSDASDAVPAIVESLWRGPDETKILAMQTLTAIGAGAEPAIPELAKTLADDRWWMRRAAARALGAIGAPARQVALNALRSERAGERAAAALVLARLGPGVEGTEAALVSALRDPSERVRATAAAALAGFGPDAFDALCLVLRDEPTVAQPAAESLKTIRVPAEIAVPKLSRALGCAVTPILVDALETYGVDARDAVPFIVRANRSDAAYANSANLVACFHSIGPPSADALGELITLLESDDAKVRYSAARGLGLMQGQAADAIAVLIERLADDDGGVRIEAAEALWRINGDTTRSIPILEAAFSDDALDQRASKLAEEIGPAAVPALMRLLRHDNEKARWWAAVSLKNIESSPIEAVPELVRALSDEDKNVRWMAGQAVVEIARGSVGADNENTSPAADKVVLVLMELLASDDAEARQIAARSLNAIGPVAAEAVPQLLAMARSGTIDPDDLAASVENMGPAAREAIPFLLETLDRSDDGLRRGVVTALCHIAHGDRQATDALLAKAREDRNFDAEMFTEVGALGIVAAEFIPLFESELQSNDSEAVESAAEGLGGFGPLAMDSLPLLIATLNNSHGVARFEVSHAIWRIGGDFRPLADSLRHGFMDEQASEEDRWFGKTYALERIDLMGAAAAPLVPVLAEILGTNDRDYDVNIANLLGQLGAAARDAVPALTSMAADPRWYIRQAANKALTRIARNAEEQP